MAEFKFTSYGDLIKQSDYSWKFMRMFRDMWCTAPQEIRREILADLEKEAKFYDERCHMGEYCDCSHAVNLGHQWQGWGDNRLYVWLNADGVPFYAGQAKCYTRRPLDIKYKTRSEEFKDVVRGGGCHVVIVAENIPGSKINELEKELIAYLFWKKYPIVNKRDLPSLRERNFAAFVSEKSNLDIESVFLANTEYRSEMESIFSVLKQVVGAKWEGECAVLSETPKLEAV